MALDPGRADGRVRLIFKSVGKIHNRASRIARGFPTLAGRGRVRGEEREIQVLELLVAHALDERYLVAHGFQLSKSLVVVQQLHVDRRKVAIVEDLGDFLSA